MRIKLLGVVLLLVVGIMAAPAAASGFFTDDDDSVHMRAIEAIADEGITKGCNPAQGNTLFCPKASVTREQMATFLVRALDLPAAAPSFIDLGTSVHAADIGALAAAGITKGCNPSEGNTRFCPTAPVTREQMATFLARALDLDLSPRVVTTDRQDLFGVELGTSETAAVDALIAVLGTPTEDVPYACPYVLFADPNMRRVRWGSLEATIHIRDTGSGLGLAGWRYGTLGGVFETGGPKPEHVVLPLGLELGDPIGDAATASGIAIRNTNVTWRVVDLGYARIEADGFVIDPNAPITGVDVGFGFECE